MNKNKTFLRRALLGAALLAAPALAARAQTPGSGGPEPQDPQAATEVPLDGGASLLLAGGVAYGLRKLRARRKAAR